MFEAPIQIPKDMAVVLCLTAFCATSVEIDIAWQERGRAPPGIAEEQLPDTIFRYGLQLTFPGNYYFFDSFRSDRHDRLLMLARMRFEKFALYSHIANRVAGIQGPERPCQRIGGNAP